MVAMNSNGQTTSSAKQGRMATLQWYYHRLRVMDAAEVVGRVREKLRTRTEARDASALEGTRVRAEPMPTPVVPSLSGMPEELRETLARDARKLLAGSWCLYGWRDIQVSLPPAWHRDYAGGVEVAGRARHLNHRSLPPGADARTIWEINRWAEMVRLAMHGRANGDLPAVATAQTWLADWVDQNIMGHGVNWTSALEGGLRLINFCWLDALVRDGDEAPARKDAQIMAAQRRLVDAIIPAHVWWVKRYASFGSSANNHRLGELTGLLLAVRRWPEMEKIVGSAEELWKEISRCVLAQFAEDGGNHEQALHYHLFAFEMALHACRAMKVSSSAVVDRLKRAAEFFSRMEHPGEAWDYGDSDDAQIVPLAVERTHAPSEWRHWLLGDGHEDSQALQFWFGAPGPLEVTKSAQVSAWWATSESGMAMGQIASWRVRFDASPLGFGKMAAHGHGDALHVSLWDGSEALVIDPGTGGYFGAKELRAELAAWEAHNGPQPLEGYKTPRRMGAFLLTQHHAPPLLKPLDGEDGAAVQATLDHEGHRFTRVVSFRHAAGQAKVHVSDQVARGARFRVRWYFAPECEVNVESPAVNGEDREVRIRRGQKLWMMALRGPGLMVEMYNARASRSYGRVEPCVVVEVRATGTLETSFFKNPK